MLLYLRTSLFDSPAQTLVNTVNCVGVMGKGLAREFKEREPAMFISYKRICENKQLEPGKLWLWRGSKNWILNFPTKIHWKNPSKMEWIEAGLAKFVLGYKKQGITEVSFPRLGCGNGDLNWDEVRPLMEQYLSDINIPVYIHDYSVDIGVPEHLEAASQQLLAEKMFDQTFDGFLKAVRRLADLCGEEMVELSSREPFRVSVEENSDVLVKIRNIDMKFESEDLRGVWLGLQTGLLTKEKAGWAMRESGKPLLSFLSLLPGAKPIEIQRQGVEEPEIALQWSPAIASVATAEQSIN